MILMLNRFFVFCGLLMYVQIRHRLGNSLFKLDSASASLSVNTSFLLSQCCDIIRHFYFEKINKKTPQKTNKQQKTESLNETILNKEIKVCGPTLLKNDSFIILLMPLHICSCYIVQLKVSSLPSFGSDRHVVLHIYISLSFYMQL